MSLSPPQRLRKGSQRGGRKDVRATRKAKRGMKCGLTFRHDVAVELTVVLISTQDWPGNILSWSNSWWTTPP